MDSLKSSSLTKETFLVGVVVNCEFWQFYLCKPYKDDYNRDVEDKEEDQDEDEDEDEDEDDDDDNDDGRWRRMIIFNLNPLYFIFLLSVTKTD